MRILMLVEDHRETQPYYLELDNEFLEAHPELTLKSGELLGLAMKAGATVRGVR